MNTPRVPCPLPCLLRSPVHLHAAAFAALLVAGSALPAAAERLPHQIHDLGDHEVQIAILYPCDESTVFDEDGKIDVEIAVSPSFKLSAGDRIELTLDGRKIRRRNDRRFVLEDLDRGPHYLRARMLDEHGHVVSHAEPVQFYMWPMSAFAPPQ